MCFNSAKNYQLGWFDLQTLSIDPLEYVDNPQSFVLNGVADYKVDGSSNGELISLRLEMDGLEGGIDYFLVCIIIIIVIVSSKFNKMSFLLN